MSALDGLKAAIAARQAVLKQLEATEAQSHESLVAAQHALSVANRAWLKTQAPIRTKDGDKIKFSHPEPPSDAVMSELKKAKSVSAANVERCKELEKAAQKAVEDVKNELAELERTWPPELGPFPK